MVNKGKYTIAGHVTVCRFHFSHYLLCFRGPMATVALQNQLAVAQSKEMSFAVQ